MRAEIQTKIKPATEAVALPSKGGTPYDDETLMNTTAVYAPDVETRSSLPSRLYLDHSHGPVLAPAT